MSLIVAKSVQFGTRKTGLSTIGFTLLNVDSTEKQARSTAGISELVASTGIYGGELTLETDWKGFIVWDTGDASVKYASESHDPRFFSAQGGGGVFIGGSVGGKQVWSEEEKQKVLKRLTRLIGTMEALGKVNVQESIEHLEYMLKNQNVKYYLQIKEAVDKSRDALKEFGIKSSHKNIEIKELNEKIGTLGEALGVILEDNEFNQIVQGV